MLWEEKEEKNLLTLKLITQSPLTLLEIPPDTQSCAGGTCEDLAHLADFPAASGQSSPSCPRSCSGILDWQSQSVHHIKDKLG